MKFFFFYDLIFILPILKSSGLILFHDIFFSIASVMKEAGCPVPEYMLNLKRPDK